MKAARTASKDKPTKEASKKGKGSKEKAKAAYESKPTQKGICERQGREEEVSVPRSTRLYEHNPVVQWVHNRLGLEV